MPTFGQQFLMRLEQNLLGNINNVPGAVSTGFATYTNLTNVFLGSTYLGRVLQFARTVEAAAISYATGTTTPNYPGLANATAGLVLSGVLIFTTAPTVTGAILGTVAAIGISAAAQALYDTIAEFYPNLLDDFGNAIVDALNEVTDAIDEIVRDMAAVAAFIADAIALFEAIADAFEWLPNPLSWVLRDPLILDLDNDGVELSALEGSDVHFDYDGDGFAERTGWVSADDGILVLDQNGNGQVDGARELFGSATQDGFAVLETLDSNRDGVINAADEAFDSLRIWRDLNQNGVTDPGELQTLTEAGVAEVRLARIDLPGNSAGHGLGFEATFVLANGATGTAQTVYFQTDRQDTRADNTPPYTAAEGVDRLPTLSGSGTIHSIRHKATFDSDFRAAWTALTDQASAMDPAALRTAFTDLLLRWAGVDQVEPGSRGSYVDARHLAFVEAFLGNSYREVQAGEELRTFPSSVERGAAVEAYFQQAVSILQTVFLSQVSASVAMRGGVPNEVIESPYSLFSILTLSDEPDLGDVGPETPGNVGAVLDLLVGDPPESAGAGSAYVIKGLLGLEGMVALAFGGDRGAYADVVLPYLASIADPVLRAIATDIVEGTALVGSAAPEGVFGSALSDILLAGGGGDFVDGKAGNDIYMYNKSDGDLWIRDEGMVADSDRLVVHGSRRRPGDLRAGGRHLNHQGDGD